MDGLSTESHRCLHTSVGLMGVRDTEGLVAVVMRTDVSGGETDVNGLDDWMGDEELRTQSQVTAL